MDYVEVLETINIRYERNASKRIREIIREFKKGLIKFDYGGDSVGLSLLFDEIIIYRRTASKKEVTSINKKISSISSTIDSIIENKPDYIKNDNPNYLEIKKIHYASSSLGLIHSKKRIKESNQIYDFLRFIIFESKDISLIKRIITDYLDIINSVSSTGISIVEEITEKYIFNLDEYVKNNDIKSRNNLLFYDEVLHYLLIDNDSKYIMSEESQKKSLIMLDEFLENYLDYYIDKSFMIWVYKMIDNLTNRDRPLTEEEVEITTDIHKKYPDSIMFIIKNDLFPNYENELAKRDHSDEYIVTIDGKRAKVLDDGLSATLLPNGNYLLGVHISDPLGYFGPGSKLIEEAYKRTNSIYYDGKPIHIFPDEVYERTSLSSKNDCLVLSYYLEIDRSGNILLDHFRIKKQVVDIAERLSYDKADEIITASSISNQLDETMTNLAEITTLLRKRLNLSKKIPEELLSIDENESSDIVQYTMFATNMTVANFMATTDSPFIYIANGQKELYFDKLDKINPANLPDRDTRGIYKYLKGFPGRSFYTTNPKQVHQALGGVRYTRVTSPLIMFGDLLATSALHSIYFGELEPEEVESFRDKYKEMTKYMNHKVKTINYYERNYPRIKKD